MPEFSYMYEILHRPLGRGADSDGRSPAGVGSIALVVHMRQNRSFLPEEGRIAFAALSTLFLLASVLPALNGNWLVAFYSIGAMAILLLALEAHQRQAPYSETLEIAENELRYRDNRGREAMLPRFWLHFEAESRTPSDVRLILRDRAHSLEFGGSLSLEERQSVAPLIASALSAQSGGRR
jgi:uncharacterized membrane protein